jgi:thiosulfate/3-mercaptopyruvate sulfurtransferase
MAARLWWLLRWLGHEAVALLDLGYPKWVREKRPITTDLPKIQPTQFHPTINHSMCVDADYVMQMTRAKEGFLIDARAEERFRGEVELLDKVAGHIPGAINLPYEDNLDFTGEFMSDEALREHYQSVLGQVPPDKVVHMCGSGVTACHSVLAMEHAGLSGAKLYAGSWSEWITDPARPVAKGEVENNPGYDLNRRDAQERREILELQDETPGKISAISACGYCGKHIHT